MFSEDTCSRTENFFIAPRSQFVVLSITIHLESKIVSRRNHGLAFQKDEKNEQLDCLVEQ